MCQIYSALTIYVLFHNVLNVNWIPFGTSLMKKKKVKNMIIYKYLMPMIADILILGVIVF